MSYLSHHASSSTLRSYNGLEANVALDSWGKQ